MPELVNTSELLLRDFFSDVPAANADPLSGEIAGAAFMIQ
jgi:hypothetical protein